jgi:DNA-binding phage protein
MPRRSQLYRAPRDWLAEGTWPDGRFAADAPDVVAYAAEISRRVAQASAGRAKATLARDAGIERTTLYDMLSGRSWPDAVTLAKLEMALDSALWPPHPVPPLRR